MKLDFKKIKKIAKEPMSLTQKISLLPELDKFNKFFLYVYSKEKDKALESFPMQEIMINPDLVKEIIFEDVFKDILLEKLNLRPFFFIDYFSNRDKISKVFPKDLIIEINYQMERNLEIIAQSLYKKNLLKQYLNEIIKRNNYFYSMYFHLVKPEDFSTEIQEKMKEHARSGNISPLKIMNILKPKEIQSIFLALFKKDDLIDFIFKINDNNFKNFKRLNVQTKYFLKKLMIEKLKNENYDVLKKIVFNKKFYIKNLKEFKINEEYKFLVHSYEDKIAKDNLVLEIDFNNFELVNLFLKNYTFSEIYELIRKKENFKDKEDLRTILLFEISKELSVDQLIKLPNMFSKKNVLKIILIFLNKKNTIPDLILIKKFIKENKMEKDFINNLSLFSLDQNENNIFFNIHFLLELKELKKIYTLKTILEKSHEKRLFVFFKSLNIIEKIEFWKLIKKELSVGNIRAYNFIELLKLEDYTKEVTDYSRFIKSLSVERKYYIVHFQEYLEKNIPPWQYPYLFDLKYSKKSFDKIFNKTEKLDKKGFFLKKLFSSNPQFINKETIPKLIKKEKTLELLIKNFMLIPKKDQKTIIEKLLVEHKTNLDKFFRIPKIHNILLKKDYKDIISNYNNKPYQGHKSIIDFFKANEDFKEYFINKVNIITDIDVISFFLNDMGLSSSEKIELLEKTNIKGKILDFNIDIEDISKNEVIYILNNFRIKKELYYRLLAILNNEDWNEKWFTDEKSLEIYIQRFNLDSIVFKAIEKNPIILNLTKEYFYNQISEKEKLVFLKSLYRNLKIREYSSSEYKTIVLNILKYYPEEFLNLIEMFKKSDYPENIFKTIFYFHRKIPNKVLLDIYKESQFKQKKTFLKNFIKIDWNDIKDKNLFNLIFKDNYFKEDIQVFLDLDFWINKKFNIDEFKSSIKKLNNSEKKMFFLNFFKEIDSFVVSKTNFNKIWNTIDLDIQKEIVSSIYYYKIFYILGNKDFNEFSENLKDTHISNFSSILNLWHVLDDKRFTIELENNINSFNPKNSIKILNKTKINFNSKDNEFKNNLFLSTLNKKMNSQINFNRLNDFWKSKYIDYLFKNNLYKIDKSGLYFETGKDIVFCKQIYDIKYYIDNIEKENNIFLNQSKMNYRLFLFSFSNKKNKARSDFKIEKLIKRKKVEKIEIDINDIHEKDGFVNSYSEIFLSSLDSIKLKYEEKIKDIRIDYIKKNLTIDLKENLIFDELYEIYSLIESFNYFCQKEFYDKLQNLHYKMDDSIKQNYVNSFNNIKNNLNTLEKYQEAYYYSEFLKLKKTDISFQYNGNIVKNNFKEFLIFLNIQYAKNKKVISLEKGYSKLGIYQVNYQDRGLRNYKLISKKEDILRLLESLNVDLKTVDEKVIEKNEFIYKINNLYYVK